MQVNTEAAVDENQVLLAGDRVEVFLLPSSRKLTQQQLDAQREKLQRLMGASPSTQYAQKAKRSPLQPVV